MAHSGAYLSPSDYSERFRRAWDNAATRFLKVERRQWYDQTGDPSYDAFVAGDYEKASQLLKESLETQGPMYKAALQREVQLVRLRLTELPLSDYLRNYEFPSYRVSEALGESIFIKGIDPTEPSRDSLPDCTIFDSKVMFVNAYDGCGRLVGAIEISDPAEISHHRTKADTFLTDAEPLEVFMAANQL